MHVFVCFRELFFAVSEKEIAVALTEQKNVGFRHVYNSAVVEGYCNQLMETLDAGMVPDMVSKSENVSQLS